MTYRAHQTRRGRKKEKEVNFPAVTSGVSYPQSLRSRWGAPALPPLVTEVCRWQPRIRSRGTPLGKAPAASLPPLQALYGPRAAPSPVLWRRDRR